jgi:hypothetical protein
MAVPIRVNTAAAAARQTLRALTYIAKKNGYTPPILQDRTTIVWEEGPYEWPIILTGGGSIWDEECGGKLYESPAEITFEMPDVIAEPDNNYSLTFYKC